MKNEHVFEKITRTNSAWIDPRSNLLSLKSEFSNTKSAFPESSLSYSLYLVGIISCIETFVRQTIRDFIDSDSTYADRVEKLKFKLDFNLETVRNLQQKKFTLGELVSNSIQISSMDHIVAYLSVILDGRLDENLKNIKEFVEPNLYKYFPYEEMRVLEEERLSNQAPPSNIIDNSDEVIGKIGDFFKKRHIAAHEGRFDLLDESELELAFDVAEKFIEAIGEIYNQLLFPEAPRTGYGGSIYAEYEANKLVEEIDRLYSEIALLLQKSGEPELPLQATIDSKESFMAHLNAEIMFESARTGVILGNSLRFQGAIITQDLCKTQISRLKICLSELEDIDKALGSGPDLPI